MSPHALAAASAVITAAGRNMRIPDQSLQQIDAGTRAGLESETRGTKK